MDINKKKEIIKEAALKEAAMKMRRDTIAKVASFKSPSDALKIVGIIGGVIILGRMAAKISEIVEGKYMKSIEPMYFEKMLKSNPDLMNEDVEEVAELWGTMYRTAPHLAQDPIAAGGFITQNINARVRQDLGGPTIDTYDTLSKIENNLKYDGEGIKDLAGAGSMFFG